MRALAQFGAGLLLLALVAVLLIPAALAWALVLLLCHPFCRPRRRTAASATGPESAPAPRRTDAASIMILNWNGEEFLHGLLPSLRKAVACHGGDHEIIVIDNGSTDGSIAFVEREYPEVRILRHATNLKFVRGYNEAWSAATRDIVVLLNNDMVVDENFLGPLLAGFTDPRTFAVSAQIFLADEDAPRVETGLTGGRLDRGVLKLWHDPIPDSLDHAVPVLWAGGGSAAFDRRRLLELGGFDPIYDPFYFEDTGLSFEAWKRGNHVLMAPASKVVHAHQGSSKRITPGFVATVKRRNRHLFVWRHCTDLGPSLASALLLPLNVPRLALTHRGAPLWNRAVLETRGILATLPRLLPTLAARIRNGRLATRTDAEVWALSQSHHRLASQAELGVRAPDATEPPSPAPGGSDAADAPDPEEPGPLRILMLAGRVPKRGVDGSWGLLELMRILGTRHQVTACVLMDNEEDAPFVDALRPFVHRLEAYRIEPTVGETDLHHRVPPNLRTYYSAPELRQRLRGLLHTQAFDIVQVDYIEMAALARPWVDGLRSVLVVHEPWFEAIGSKQTFGLVPRLKRKLAYMQAANYEARLYARFRVLSCFTDADAKALRRCVRSARIEINPMGPNLEEIEACPPSTGCGILSVGYFGHTPNVDATRWFITAVLPRVRAAIPDCTLRLVGGGASAEIEQLAQSPGVELLGRVPSLVAEMERCAVTLAPVREGGGLRTKVLESFAYGRTVVATPVGVAGIPVTDGVECRVATDAPGFAAALIQLLQSEDGRHAMEQRARQLIVDRFDARQMARRSENLYRDLLAEDRAEDGGARR